MKIDFRSDIQVLRAIAIIAVVGYHMGIPGFQNGFFGVDVFFVLSGYLMAQVYTKGKTKQFFVRRARRLLPAYLVTIFSTLFIGFLLAVPSDFSQVYKQSLFSMGLIPNFYFWSQDSYFSNSNLNPLLHLWSLGVEFQFYLFVPLIILFLRNRILPYVALAICTLALSLALLSISPKTSFFIFPLRGWEFLLGMLLLYSEKRFVILKSCKERPWIGIPLLASGLLLAVYPVNGFSTSPLLGHPGVASMIAVSFSLLFLLYRVEIGSLFIRSKLEALGKYSYAVYLTHYPVLVYINYIPFGGTVSKLESLFSTSIAVLLIISLSYLLHRFVEEKYQKKGFRPQSLIPFSIILVLIFTQTPRLKISNLTILEKNIVMAASDRESYRCGKVFRIFNPISKVCVVGQKGLKENVLLLGNSHADSIKVSFSRVANSLNKSVYFWVQNNPMMFSPSEINDVMKEVSENDISSIHLHYSLGAVNRDNLHDLGREAEKAGVALFFLGPIPTWDEKIPKLMWQSLSSQHLDKSELYLRANPADDNQKSMWLEYNIGTIEFIDLVPEFCQNLCRFASPDGRPFYWDEEHLTLTGARVLEPSLKGYLER